MKRILAIAAVAILAACGGQAKAAAPTAEFYASSSGEIVNLRNALIIDPVSTPGMVIVTYTNNSQATAIDSGALINRIVTNNQHLLQLPDGRYFDPNVVSNPTCVANKLNLQVYAGALYQFNDPGCGMYNQLKTKGK